jgi:hypothetical protein
VSNHQNSGCSNDSILWLLERPILNQASSGDPGQGIIDEFRSSQKVHSTKFSLPLDAPEQFTRSQSGFAIQVGGDFAWVARACLKQEHATGGIIRILRP